MKFTQNSNQFKISEFLSSRFFYLMSVGVLLAWVIVSGIVDTTIFVRNDTQNLIRLFFLVGIFGLLLSHKIIRRITFVIFVAGTLFIAASFLFTAEESIFNNNFTELISRTINFIFGNRPYQAIYETFTIWTISLFFSFFVAFFTYYKFQFWVLFSVSVATTSLAITSPHFRHAPIFYIYAFCLLALTVKYLQEKKLEKISIPSKPSILTQLVIPLIAVVLLFAHLMPTPQAGFSENLVRRPFDFLNNLFWEMTHQSEFSLRQIGFGETGGRLGGDLALNDGVFMEIELSDGISQRMPIYLTGATRDTYTGYSWENLHDQFELVYFNEGEQNLEWIESLLSGFFYDLQWQAQLTNDGELVQVDTFEYLLDHWNDIDINDYETTAWVRNLRIFVDEATGFSIWITVDPRGYLNISDIHPTATYYLLINNLGRRLRSMFHTGVVRDIYIDTVNNDAEYPIFRNRDAAFWSQERLRSNTTYRVEFQWMQHYRSVSYNFDLPIDRNLQEISQALQLFRDDHGYDLEVWPIRIDLNGNVLTIEEVINQYLIPRANRINEIYTTLPDDLPDRVRELALEVTSEGENNYQRMRLLESFLSESFYYTLTPGSSPTDQDFVDHFLFDLQEGYCVHFATAFVIMARSLGMPVRYAEGFLVNVPDMSGTIEVLNRMAHAWPEVYFEGFGWVIFEPTPASGIGLVQEDGDDSYTGDNQGFPGWDGEDMIVPPQDPLPVEPTIDDFINGGGAPAVTEETLEIPWWVFGGAGVLLAIVVLIFIRVTQIHLKRELITKKEGRERVLVHFKVLLAYLKVFDHELREVETVSQFANRIGSRRNLGALSSERDLLKQSVAIFIKARYSNQDISKEDCFPVEEIVRNMEHRTQLKLGKVKYLFYCYILGRFS